MKIDNNKIHQESIGKRSLHLHDNGKYRLSMGFLAKCGHFDGF